MLNNATSSEQSSSGIWGTISAYMPSFRASPAVEPEAIVCASYDEQSYSWSATIGNALSQTLSWANSALQFGLNNWHHLSFIRSSWNYVTQSQLHMTDEELLSAIQREAQESRASRRPIISELLNFIRSAFAAQNIVRDQYKDTPNVNESLSLIESIMLGHKQLASLTLTEVQLLNDLYKVAVSQLNNRQMKFAGFQYATSLARVSAMRSYQFRNAGASYAVVSSVSTGLNSLRHYYNGDSARAREALYNGIRNTAVLSSLALATPVANALVNTLVTLIASEGIDFTLPIMIMSTIMVEKIRAKFKLNAKDVFLSKRHQNLQAYYMSLSDGNMDKTRELAATLKQEHGIDPTDVQLLAEVENISPEAVKSKIKDLTLAGLFILSLKKLTPMDEAELPKINDDIAYASRLLKNCSLAPLPAELIENYHQGQYQQPEQLAKLKADLGRLQANYGILYEYALQQIEEHADPLVRAKIKLMDGLAATEIGNPIELFQQIKRLQGTDFHDYFRQRYLAKIEAQQQAETHTQATSANPAITPLADSARADDKKPSPTPRAERRVRFNV